MTARARVLAIVAAAAALAVAGTVTITWLQTRGETTQAAGAVTKPRPGVPPLTLDFGVRSDAEAKALDRGELLLRKGKRDAALRIFSRYDSVDAQIGVAFASWPKGGLDTLKRLVASHPRNAVAQAAAAVGTFTKRNPVGAFSRLGPLSGEFPRAGVVRLHLGILLLWTGQIRKAAAQFRLALADEPGSTWAKAARGLLSAIPATGTK